MQRYYIESTFQLGDIITLDPNDHHHLTRVMRAKVGTELELVHQGQVFLGHLMSFDKNESKIKVIEKLNARHTELPVEVVIAVGLSKNDKLDWIAQKGTECGMSMLIPLELKRNVVKWSTGKQNKRVERLSKIVKEATQQSQRLLVPKIEPLMSIDQIIQYSDDFEVKLIAYEEEAKNERTSNLKSQLQSIAKGDQVIMVFGSEGGLDSLEIEKLKGAGFVSCSLGPRILRAETAPIYFLSALSYELELTEK